MSGELTALLLKALRSLAPEEQDKVMSELLSARLEWQPGPLAEPVSHAAPPSLGAHMLSELRVSLASESGGPWRTVPVRLPVELHERLKQWCQANNFTMAVVLRGLVARFLDEYGAPVQPGQQGRSGSGTG